MGAALRLGIKLLTICGYDFPKPFGDLRVQLMEGSLNAFPIRVLLVDDFKPWHGVISATLQKQPELQVIGQVFDGFNAVQQAQELQPDLILLDIGLPTLNGIEAARQIGEVSPNSKILFVSENRSPDIAEEALRTGASGYVVKSDVANELLPAIRAVLEGKHFLSISLADRVSLDLTQRPAEQPV